MLSVIGLFVVAEDEERSNDDDGTKISHWRNNEQRKTKNLQERSDRNVGVWSRSSWEVGKWMTRNSTYLDRINHWYLMVKYDYYWIRVCREWSIEHEIIDHNYILVFEQ